MDTFKTLSILLLYHTHMMQLSFKLLVLDKIVPIFLDTNLIKKNSKDHFFFAFSITTTFSLKRIIFIFQVYSIFLV